VYYNYTDTHTASSISSSSHQSHQRVVTYLSFSFPFHLDTTTSASFSIRTHHMTCSARTTPRLMHHACTSDDVTMWCIHYQCTQDGRWTHWSVTQHARHTLCMYLPSICDRMTLYINKQHAAYMSSSRHTSIL
jgi:hypothetical protein